MSFFVILSLIILPESYFASTTNFIKMMTNDLKELIILVLGIAISFYVINELVKLTKKAIK